MKMKNLMFLATRMLLLRSGLILITVGVSSVADAIPLSVTGTMTGSGITLPPITVYDNQTSANGDYNPAVDQTQFYFATGGAATTGTILSPGDNGTQWVPIIACTSPPYFRVPSYWDPGAPYDTGMWITGMAGDVVKLEVKDSYPGALPPNSWLSQTLSEQGYFYFPSAQVGMITLTTTVVEPISAMVTASFNNTYGAGLVTPFGPVVSNTGGPTSSSVPVDFTITATFGVDGAIFLPNSVELATSVPEQPSSLLLLGAGLLSLTCVKRKLIS
jgi:hypothetical protein